MTKELSRFAPQLSELGFDCWSGDDLNSTLSAHDQQELRIYGPLTFIYADLFHPGLTFAFDEYGGLWAANDTVDLSSLGFTEIKVDENGVMQPPTKH
jgi:hypothetical protein